MPININPNGSISISGEDGMFTYRLLTVYRGLKLQAETGMKLCRISTVKAAQEMGFKGRTCKALIKDIETHYPELKN